MFAGDWILLGDNYIEEVLDSLVGFFEDYCHEYLGENVLDADWNYDDYFKEVYRKIKNPVE